MKEKYTKLYRFCAFQTFNTLVFLVLFNIFLGILFWIQGCWQSVFAPKFPPVSKQNVNRSLQKYVDFEAYSQISLDDAKMFLHEQYEMGDMGLQYAPWVQFRNPEFHGIFLNTDKNGFRKIPLSSFREGESLQIHVFGGSTTFGYGVPDDYTIPSFIQDILEQKLPNRHILVRNYGQASYYSSQEMLLFISLIKKGNIPEYAIFIDGLNDTDQLGAMHDQPYYTPQLKFLWDSQTTTPVQKVQHNLSWIPIIRLAHSLRYHLTDFQDKLKHNEPDRENILPEKQIELDENEEQRKANYVLQRYTSNIRIIRSICKEYGIKCDFVWQPAPNYKFQRILQKGFEHLVGAEGPDYWYVTTVYSEMKNYIEPDFLYLGDLLDGVSEKAFVDRVHYNEKYNKIIAEKICEVIQVD